MKYTVYECSTRKHHDFDTLQEAKTEAWLMSDRGLCKVYDCSDDDGCMVLVECWHNRMVMR